MKLLNKKGDAIPIFILVVGVVAICILAIVSFSVSQKNNKKFLGSDVFEEIYSAEEKFYFYVATDNRNVSFLEKAELAASKISGVNVIEPIPGKHYLEISQDKYNFSLSARYRIPLD